MNIETIGVNTMAIKVSNLNSSKIEDLRAGIEQADANGALDVITFTAARSDTITIESALPEITRAVTIQALTVQSAPAIPIDARHHAVLVMGSGSKLPSLIGLSLVGTSNDGLTLLNWNNSIKNIYIGVESNDSTTLANQANDIRVEGETTDISSAGTYTSLVTNS